MQKLKIVLPKGRLFDKLEQLFSSIGIKMKLNKRSYIPKVSAKNIEIKIMKPQNIPKVIEMGSHDLGFTGKDWIKETRSNVDEIIDLNFDKVKIVSAIPNNIKPKTLKDKKIVAATEYPNIAEKYLKSNNYNFVILKTYGTTEVFPPDDADMIIDNTSTGTTLRQNNLKILDKIIESSTVMIANKNLKNNSFKFNYLKKLKMLINSVLNANRKVILEMNVEKQNLQQIIDFIPSMRSPTVSRLYNSNAYSIKTAVSKNTSSKLIPKLKKLGAKDILEYSLRKVIIWVHYIKRKKIGKTI